MKNSELVQMRANLFRINTLMEKGIQTDADTGKMYFTGYSYNTLYDWDQYFEAIPQIYLGWDTKYIKNGVTIFLDNQQENGFIMRRIPGESTKKMRNSSDPNVRLCNEQEDIEMVKPFLSQIALLVYKEEFDLSWITPDYYEKLKKYIIYWITEMDKNNNGLSTWRSGPHSGMDDQVERVGAWGACISEGVDLNCFLYRECVAFSLISGVLENKDEETFFSHKAEQLKQLIKEKMWCEEDGFFYDLHEKTGQFIRVKSSCGFAPLWAGIATKEQAQRLVSEHLLNPKEFWRAFPISSYAATEQGYREVRKPNDVGCNWRAQTWIPVNYYVLHGLMDYGYLDIAKQLAYKTYELINKIGDREYYNSDSCSGNGLDPFWGWSLLAYFMPLEFELKFDPTKLNFGILDLAKIKML